MTRRERAEGYGLKDWKRLALEGYKWKKIVEKNKA
jgi:hypothetical protein